MIYINCIFIKPVFIEIKFIISENPLTKEHIQQKLYQETNLYLQSCLLKLLLMLFLSLFLFFSQKHGHSKQINKQ